jgi:hypothetical protein
MTALASAATGRSLQAIVTLLVLLVLHQLRRRSYPFGHVLRSPR